MEQTEFRIGEVAMRAGVSVDALRYYERVKLLPHAKRSSGGFRLFGFDAIERVQFIKQGQELGLTLDEIKGLLATGGDILHKINDEGVIRSLRQTVPGIDEGLWRRLPALAPGQAIVSASHMTRALLVSIDPSPCQLRMID